MTPQQPLRAKAERVLTMAIFAAMFFASTPASAYRQSLTATGAAVLWTKAELNLLVPLDGAPSVAAGRNFTRAVAVAADRWNQPTCTLLRFNLMDASANPATILRPDIAVHVQPAWSDPRQTRTRVDFDPTSGAIRFVRIDVDAGLLSASAAKLEFELTVALGHAIGFGLSADSKALMHGSFDATPHAVLKADDIAGLCAAYPRRHSTEEPKGADETPVRKKAQPVQSSLRVDERETKQRKTLSLNDKAARARIVVVVVGLLLTSGWLGALWFQRRRRRRQQAEAG